MRKNKNNNNNATTIAKSMRLKKLKNYNKKISLGWKKKWRENKSSVNLLTIINNLLRELDIQKKNISKKNKENICSEYTRNQPPLITSMDTILKMSPNLLDLFDGICLGWCSYTEDLSNIPLLVKKLKEYYWGHYLLDKPPALRLLENKKRMSEIILSFSNWISLENSNKV